MTFGHAISKDVRMLKDTNRALYEHSTTEGRSAESSKNLLGRHLAAGFNLSDFRGTLTYQRQKLF
jgi:hypothetical protein